MTNDKELSTHNRFPTKLDSPLVATLLLSISSKAPDAPMKTPIVFCQVIGSLRNNAAKSMVNIGETVVITEASIGEVLERPIPKNT